MPDFQIPSTQAEYTGDPSNKKDQMAHRKHLAQLELQVQCKKVPIYAQTAWVLPACFLSGTHPHAAVTA